MLDARLLTSLLGKTRRGAIDDDEDDVSSTEFDAICVEDLFSVLGFSITDDI
jgi:hypothetical protein